NRRHGFRGGGLLKSALARQHFIEDGAECKNVRAMIGALTADLLWGHIADSAHDHAGLRDAANGNRAVLGSLQRLGELGQSEVKDFDAPLFGKKKIFRLEVAMDDAAIMSGLQAMGDLHAVVNHFADGQGAAFHGLAEIFAGEQLRDEIGRALVAAHVVHSQNVWMIQSGGGASFLFKALQALRVSGEIQQHFYGNITVELRVARAIDLSHAPNADEGEDFVGAKASAREDGHGRRDYTSCK